MGVHGISDDAGFTTPNLLEAETDQRTDRRRGAGRRRRRPHQVGRARPEPHRAARGCRRPRLRRRPVARGAGDRSRSSIDQVVDRARASRPRGRSRAAVPLRTRSGAVADVRSSCATDVHTGIHTYVVGSRQARPNLPAARLPVLPRRPRGARALRRALVPEPLAGDARRAVRGVLYTPEHDATFWSLGAAGARRVIDLWAERTAALGGAADIDYVLVFENRGAEVGATIRHPHGQIYAFDFVPELPLRELERARLFDEPGDRLVATSRRLAGLGSGGAGLPLRAHARPRRAGARPAVARRRRPRRARRAARRRARAARPALRRADAVHALDPPAAVRRRRLARRACTSRSSHRGVPRACPASSPPASSGPASTSTRSRRRPPRSRSAKRCGARRPTALEALLYPGGTRELGAARAHEPEPALPAARDPRPPRRRSGRRRRSLDGEWEFRLVAAPRRRAAARSAGRAAGTGSRCRASGRCSATSKPQYTNVVMPFREPAAARPEENPTGIYRRAFSDPARLGRAADRARLRRHRGGAPRRRQRRSRSASRRTRGRRPSSTSPTSSATPRAERARRRRRPLVRRELHRGSGSVVACGHLAREVYLRCRRASRTSSARDARRRLPTACSRSTRGGGPLEATLLDPARPVVLAGDSPGGSRRALRSPRLWSAEEPALYTLVLSDGGESVAAASASVASRSATAACS